MDTAWYSVKSRICPCAVTTHIATCVSDPALSTALTVTTLMFFAVPKSMYILPLPVNCSTASVNCHFDGLGKTAHVNGNGWKRPGVQSHEVPGCAVAPSRHNATHVPVKEGSKSSAHSLCDDVEKAGVKKLPAKPENLGSAHESWSSTRLLCSWSRGPGRARGARCSAFAESSRSCGTT